MIAVFLIGVAAVLLLHDYWYERNWSRSLSIRVLFSRPHVYAHEVLELTETIENRKKLPLPIIEIGFRLPRGLHFEDAENILESDYIYKRDLFAVRGMERIVRRYPVTAQKRGFYTVSQLTCHAPSRLFAHTYRMEHDTQDEEPGLYVYAARTDCSLLLHAVLVILGEKESTRKLYEDPFVFASIRPYTLQDPMKSVNWKATAKTGSLMVNTYASCAAVRVKIFLDVGTDPGNPFSDALREQSIALAASLIRTLVKQQLDASLVINCPAVPVSEGMETGLKPFEDRKDSMCEAVRFISCSSAGKLTAMEEFLTADFDALSLLPFEEMLRLEAERRPDPNTAAGYGDEVLVFLTSSDRPVVRAQIHRLLGLQRSGILAVPARTSDRRHQEQERNLLILPVTDWKAPSS